MDAFKDSVKKSFTACRNDIEDLKAENQILKEKLNSIEKLNESYQTDIIELKSEIKGLHIALDYIKEYSENLQKNMNNLVSEQSKLNASHEQIMQSQASVLQNQTQQPVVPNTINFSSQVPLNSQPISNHYQQQEPMQYPQSHGRVPAHHEIPKSLDPYEALLAFKAKSNKREVLKQKILSMISESGMNLSELKFMFVEHFRYCSKATFYNYLKELELERSIRIERENSKNYVYLTSMRKEI